MLSPDIYKRLQNIPISAAELIAAIGQQQRGKLYHSPRSKLVDLEQSGDIIRLKKGLYILDGNQFGFPPSAPICSNHIYGPSYLSLQWALSYYGLIPERVSSYTASTIKRSRQFENKLGLFTYYQVDRDYFGIGITQQMIDKVPCLIATPEKALVDLLLWDNHVPALSMRALAEYLEQDIRFDMDELKHFDIDILQRCLIGNRKVSTITNLIKIIRKL